jgi:xanthine dehydrogenase YagS FAD-binding subunit
LELLAPESVEAATAALGNGAVALAGGTELVPLMREGIVEPETLVQIGHVVPRGIREGWIGAGTTLGELEVDPQIPAVLREACSLAASPQLRAMGTIAGNLLQATRCWYWRLRFPCRLHGGSRCFAREGVHREHAIFANDFCASAHPSDVAAALLALSATVITDRRRLQVAELYRLPTEDDRRTTTLEPDELILELEYETPSASTYLKAMDRRRYAFAIVGVAATRAGSGTRLALAGVAPVPWLLSDEAGLDDATPLPGTGYKVDVARTLVRRAAAAVA